MSMKSNHSMPQQNFLSQLYSDIARWQWLYKDLIDEHNIDWYWTVYISELLSAWRKRPWPWPVVLHEDVYDKIEASTGHPYLCST